MVKRLTIVVFCIGLMGFWSTDAKAWPASSSGWLVKSGSIIVSSDWVHISNTDVKPTDLVVTIRPTILVYYENPAGKDGGVGTPFTLNIPLVGFDSLNPSLVGRGKANSEVTFPTITKEYLLEQGINLSDYAPNPNWEATGDIIVTGLGVKIQAYADVSDSCTTANTPPWDGQDPILEWKSCYYNELDGLFEEEVVHLEGLCTVQGNPYPCVESVHWEYSKKIATYPGY